MKHIETAHYVARHPVGQSFEAVVQEAWGVWTRMLNEEHLKGVFTLLIDAQAFAGKVREGGQSGEVRKMWVVVNETSGEAYALSGNGGDALQGVDLDFQHRMRILSLRKETLARLSDEELHALGLKRA